MTDIDEALQSTATELRMATFRLARRLRCERALDDMSDAQLAVLAGLRQHGRSTVSVLAARERVAVPTMTNTITGLVARGHAVRIPDEEDRRRVHVEITGRGDEIVVETIRRRDATLAEALAELGFTAGELATLRRASELMRRVAER